MTVAPIAGIGSVTGGAAAGGRAAAGGFGDALARGIDSVANLQQGADQLLAQFAAGGDVQIADVMTATSKATLGMQIMVEVRNRGLEAYQQIMNIQV
jgi:flagellar hook-basal body complex protein FliE